MKLWLSGLLVFFLTLGIGLWSGRSSFTEQRSDRPFSTSVETPEAVPGQITETHQAPEFTNVHLPDEFENGHFRYILPVKKGETFIGKCEVTPELKRPWLALLKIGDQYSLESPKVSFGRAQEDDFGTFMPLYFRNSKNALFLFGHSGKVIPGPVTTLYEMAPDENNESLIGSGFRREFLLGDRTYVLRVGSGLTDTNNPVDVLVLESDGKQDMLYFGPMPNSGINFGRFEWIGDLDNDKRLDLIFSFFSQNGGSQRIILFLSSAAKENHLVQPYAFFHAGFKGC